MKRMASFFASTADFGVSYTTLRRRYQANRMIGHPCELTRDHEADESKPSWKEWLKERMFRSILVSGSHPQSFIYLRSSAAVSKAAEEQIESPYWFIVHPFSEVAKIWNIFMTSVLLVYLFLMPYLVAFRQEPWTYHFYFSVDIICVADIVMNFMTGVLDTNTKDIILEPSSIARLYLRGYFFVDLFSSIPYKFIMMHIGMIRSNHNMIVATSVLTFMKILRVRTLMNNLMELSEFVQMRDSVFRVVILTIVYTLALHWTACLHFWVPISVHGDDIKNATNSWIVQLKIYRNEEPWKSYLYSFFRAASNIISLGFGQFFPNTIEDCMVTMFCVIGGAFLNAYLIGVILHSIASMTAAETKHYQTKNQLMEYMRFKKLPHLMQKRLLLLFENKYQKGYFREAAILGTLNDGLRDEISWYCCRRLLLDVAIFHHLPKEVVTAIVRKLEFEVCLPNDIIIKAGTVGDCMYFLATGTASVTTPTGKEVCHLEDGAHFGEIALVDDNEKRVASVIAVDICELYRLKRSDYDLIIAPYPDLHQQIKSTALERMRNTNSLEIEYRQFLLTRNVAKKN